MTNEERIQALEQEVAELKRGLEARPKSNAIPGIIDGLSQPLPQYTAISGAVGSITTSMIAAHSVSADSIRTPLMDAAITEAIDSVTTRFGNTEVVQTKDSITATVQPKECHPD